MIWYEWYCGDASWKQHPSNLPLPGQGTTLVDPSAIASFALWRPPQTLSHRHPCNLTTSLHAWLLLSRSCPITLREQVGFGMIETNWNNKLRVPAKCIVKQSVSFHQSEGKTCHVHKGVVGLASSYLGWISFVHCTELYCLHLVLQRPMANLIKDGWWWARTLNKSH